MKSRKKRKEGPQFYSVKTRVCGHYIFHHLLGRPISRKNLWVFAIFTKSHFFDDMTQHKIAKKSKRFECKNTVFADSGRFFMKFLYDRIKIQTAKVCISLRPNAHFQVLHKMQHKSVKKNIEFVLVFTLLLRSRRFFMKKMKKRRPTSQCKIRYKIAFAMLRW